MRKENLYAPFEIVIEKVDEYPDYERVFTFFQLVYIASGSGKQCVNKNHTNYREGDMFLITPEDCHTFEIKETTEFLLVRFNKSYLFDRNFDLNSKRQMELILQNANHKPGCILHNKSDKLFVKSIMEFIIRESIQEDLYRSELTKQLIGSLIIITARNVTKYLPPEVNNTIDNKALDILQYIQTNIFYPHKIRTDVLSEHFGISESYLGRYFKKHVSETIQQFITNYRTKMIENRLKYSDMRITEISLELGFTDESHLNKFFRKQMRMSPSEYRKDFKEKNALQN